MRVTRYNREAFKAVEKYGIPIHANAIIKLTNAKPMYALEKLPNRLLKIKTKKPTRINP